jgi:hypothetical protein
MTKGPRHPSGGLSPKGRDGGQVVALDRVAFGGELIGHVGDVQRGGVDRVFASSSLNLTTLGFPGVPVAME